MKSEVLNTESIFFDISVKNKQEVLNFLSNYLYKEGKISSIDGFLKDVYWREEQGETGIEGGLAIPHGKSDAVLQTSLCFARLANPIKWEGADGELVSVVILFAVSTNEEDVNATHIKLLATVAGNLVKSGVIDLLKKTTEKKQVIELLLT